MIEREAAVEIHAFGVKAIEDLTSALYSAQGKCSDEEYAAIKRGVGLSIGRIQMELLEIINAQYPDLDHLKDVEYREKPSDNNTPKT